jgi:hypothetical protein
MSGSVGGVTYSRGRGGAIVRLRVSPIQPDTQAQVLQRGKMTTISKLWAAGTTEAQKEAWKNTAEEHPYSNVFGESKKLSGFGTYVQMNLDSLTAGESAVAEPPESLAVEGLTSLTIAGIDPVGGGIEIEWTATGAMTDSRLIIRVANSVSPGVMFTKNLFRVAHITASNPAAAYEFFLPPSLGALIPGRVLYVQVASFNVLSRRYGGGLQASMVIPT